MKIFRIWMMAAALAPGGSAAWAEGLCAVEGPGLMARLQGDWAREGSLSMVNETTDILRASEAYRLTIGPGAALASPFIDALTGASLPLRALVVPAYDVDRVDDVLDTTGRADLADRLSDTRCGPEALPQYQAVLEVSGGMAVSGKITLIAYFDDRLLEITELELRSEDSLLFLTETVLLTRAAGE